jgi:ribosomal protein S18 acetylase RimI-like enzyme
MAAVEARALARGLCELRLESREDNAAALALYRRLGFAPFSRAERFYADGAPALRLRKPLHPMRAAA